MKTSGTTASLPARALDGLGCAARGLGIAVDPLPLKGGKQDAVLGWDGRRLDVRIVAFSQVTGAMANQIVCDRVKNESVPVVVADRITADGRAILSDAGLSWLDLRGRLHLRADGLLVDTDVPAVGKATGRSQPSIRGMAGLAVAYWSCAHPTEPLSPTGHRTDIGFAPSTISTAMSALAEAGLVDDTRRAVLPELFWELAGAWIPEWTWLAGRPERDSDPEQTWVRTGDG